MVIATEHYNRLVRMLDQGESLKMEVDLAVEFHDDDLMAYNTVAEIPGTDLKDELVMLGGHMDSWHSGTGATDNAAGVSVAMEAVRILKALDLKPRRTIRIALWTGEEQGLLGSRGYVSEHFQKISRPARRAAHVRSDGRCDCEGRAPQPKSESESEADSAPKPEHAKFSAYFNLDNGTGKVRGVYLQGNEAVRPIFRKWLQPFRDMGATTLTISNTGGTDHQSFDAVGLPGFQFIQDQIDYSTRTHHSNQDVYDRIQADDMKQAAVIMAAFVYNTAMLDEKLPRKPACSDEFGREPAMERPSLLTIKVYSDYVCPYCFLAEFPLQEAVRGKDVAVEWLPFELRPEPVPTLRPEGRVSEAGLVAIGLPDRAADGCSHRAPRGLSPATNDAGLRGLTSSPREHGKGSEYNHRLLAAFFQEGQDIGNPDVLTRLAGEVGLDRDEFAEALRLRTYRQAHERALRMRIRGRRDLGANLRDRPTGLGRAAGPRLRSRRQSGPSWPVSTHDVPTPLGRRHAAVNPDRLDEPHEPGAARSSRIGLPRSAPISIASFGVRSGSRSTPSAAGLPSTKSCSFRSGVIWALTWTHWPTTDWRRRSASRASAP